MISRSDGARNGHLMHGILFFEIDNDGSRGHGMGFVDKRCYDYNYVLLVRTTYVSEKRT